MLGNLASGSGENMGNCGKLGTGHSVRGKKLGTAVGEDCGGDELRAQLPSGETYMRALWTDLQRVGRTMRRLYTGAGNGTGAGQDQTEEKLVSRCEESAIRNIRRKR